GRQRRRHHGRGVDGHPPRPRRVPARAALPHRRRDADGDQGMRGRDGAARWVATGTPSASFGVALGVRLWRHLPDLLGAKLRFLAWWAPHGLLALVGLRALALAIAPITVGPGVIGLLTAAARVARGEPRGSGRTHSRSRRGFWTGSALAAAILLAWHAQLV